LRELYNALRWLARAGAPWRLLPTNFPPWDAVYQQTQRWLRAGRFKAMTDDLRSIIRVAHGRQGPPSADAAAAAMDTSDTGGVRNTHRLSHSGAGSEIR